MKANGNSQFVLQKGITLVALVITIIILLILAGITIATLTGKNGIITRAGQAKEATKIAQYRELVEVIIMEQQIEKIQNPEEQRPFINMVAEAIEEKEWSDKVFICDEDGIETDDIKDSTKIIVETKDGYEIRINVDNDTNTAEIELIKKGVGEIWTVKFNLNGGTGDIANKVEVRRGFRIKLPTGENLVKEGYKFVGWKQGNDIIKTNKYKPESDVTLYAEWKENIAQITLKGNGATEEQVIKNVIPGEEWTIENPFIREGYNFVGWSLEENGEVVYTDKIVTTEDIVLYAKWEIKAKVIAKNIDTSNETRKIAVPLGSLFEITWGSDGIGTTKYEVTGALLFRNKAYSSQTINSLAELELGTYQIKCTITTPQTKITESAIKTVTIGTLAPTSMNDVGGGYRSSNI